MAHRARRNARWILSNASRQYVRHLWHLPSPCKPDDVWVLEELHDPKLLVQILGIGFRIVAGLKSLDRDVPAAAVASTATQCTAEAAADFKKILTAVLYCGYSHGSGSVS